MIFIFPRSYSQDFVEQIDSIRTYGSELRFDQGDWFVQKAQLSPDGKSIWATVLDTTDLSAIQRIARFEEVDSLWQIVYLSDEGNALAGFRKGKVVISASKAGIGWEIPHLSTRGWYQNRDYLVLKDGTSLYTSNRSGHFQAYFHENGSNEDILAVEEHEGEDIINLSFNIDSTYIFFDLVDSTAIKGYYAKLGDYMVFSERTLENIRLKNMYSLSFNKNTVLTVQDGRLKAWSIQQESSKHLSMHIGSKTYAEYVAKGSFGFYNPIVDLTDSLREDTVFILSIPRVNNEKEKIFIVDTIYNKEGRKNFYMARNSAGDSLTLLPIEFARGNGMLIANNIITQENISNPKDSFLIGDYVCYHHTLENPLNKKTKLLSSQDSYSEADKVDIFRNSVEFGRQYNQDELIKLLKDAGYTEGFLQLGLYPKHGPFHYLQGLMPSGYKMERSPRGGLVQYFVRKPVDECFDALPAIKFIFNHNKRLQNDDPFIRFGPWDGGFKIVKYHNGKFIVSMI
ncbi:MAG: hypothetical protein GXP45_04550 [bacterium]|nr:hypothetical protein [bacterium]